MRGRVGGRIGGSYRPMGSAASGMWRMSEVYSAIRGVYGPDEAYDGGPSWPAAVFQVSWYFEFGVGFIDYVDVDENGDATFYARVSSPSGDTLFGYYWQRSTDSGVTWTKVTGSDGSGDTGGLFNETYVTLSLSGQAVGNNGDLYRLIVKASELKEVIGPPGDVRHPDA